MTEEEITLFFERLKQEFPNPRCELDFVSSYTLLVAIILSAQATDKGVNKATAPLFEKVKTAQDMKELGEEGLKGYIKTLNYYNTKAKNIMKMTEVLLEEFNGEVPCDFEVLQTLPGVGRKTANVFLNVWEKRPVIAVDTHVFRVANRLKIAEGKTPLDVEEKLAKVVPDAYKVNAQHWMVLFGRYICKAKNPKCESCPVCDLCPLKKI
ncbi:MAG: endonuclease III [Alphaproteobacteria bacterium]|nr:endonuclease III [Alphaproteobacteria bacterium]